MLSACLHSIEVSKYEVLRILLQVCKLEVSPFSQLCIFVRLCQYVFYNNWGITQCIRRIIIICE